MRSILSLLALVSCCTSFAAENATVPEILKDPAKYDGKTVTIKAPAFLIERVVSRAGKDYFTLNLGEPKRFVRVFGKDKLDPAVKDMDLVTVTGTYKTVRKVGPATYRNEIDCTRKLGKDFGIRK